jgi:hypothetical protein
MKPSAWLIEELDTRGNVVWMMTSFFKPTELSWMNDIKSNRHSIVITPLIKDNKAEVFTNIAKYNSKLLAEANNGL